MSNLLGSNLTRLLYVANPGLSRRVSTLAIRTSCSFTQANQSLEVVSKRIQLCLDSGKASFLDECGPPTYPNEGERSQEHREELVNVVRRRTPQRHPYRLVQADLTFLPGELVARGRTGQSRRLFCFRMSALRKRRPWRQRICEELEC